MFQSIIILLLPDYIVLVLRQQVVRRVAVVKLVPVQALVDVLLAVPVILQLLDDFLIKLDLLVEIWRQLVRNVLQV